MIKYRLEQGVLVKIDDNKDLTIKRLEIENVELKEKLYAIERRMTEINKNKEF